MSLEGFDSSAFTHAGVTRTLYRRGSGPGVVIVHEIPGITPAVADFARRVTEAGLAWIGPPPNAIEQMGDKITSRRVMQAAGVPVVPGLVDPVASAEDAVREAEDIGYPVALKAAAGGGGKGIRIVRDPSEMASAFRTASGEAETAWDLLIDRYHRLIRATIRHYVAG